MSSPALASVNADKRRRPSNRRSQALKRHSEALAQRTGADREAPASVSAARKG